jgi:hypothetical protein
MSLRGEIKNSIATRLRTITSANGYATNVIGVYANDIPMGLSLESHEVPAILLIPGNDTLSSRAQGVVFCEWTFYLQLIHADVDDDTMLNFIRDVAKALYANSATADRQDEFRTMHHSIYQFEITQIEPDLNMIEANRFAIMEIQLKYTTQYNKF